jgi:hypothetical protein
MNLPDMSFSSCAGNCERSLTFLTWQTPKDPLWAPTVFLEGICVLVNFFIVKVFSFPLPMEMKYVNPLRIALNACSLVRFHETDPARAGFRVSIPLRFSITMRPKRAERYVSDSSVNEKVLRVTIRQITPKGRRSLRRTKQEENRIGR